MRHRVKKLQKIGIDKEHSVSILRNIAASLVINEKIQTTRPRAKAVQSYVEKLITAAKKKDAQNAIKYIFSAIQHENASKKIIEDLAKRYSERTSGYTRRLRVGNRKGDNADLIQLELV
ncbi:MAG: 50S ribosomal protein L17 [Candidatus Peregrinibacteria bacterium]|nr:50S ribosomal protein L17 [Candidatus Peregrinibacteria bacterium]